MDENGLHNDRAVSDGLIKLLIEDGVAWVTLNRPEKRNAVNPALARELLGIVDALERDARCGVLVLTGAGDAFCAGLDMGEFFRDDEALAQEDLAAIRRVVDDGMWRRSRYYMKPTIAAVNGWCFGAAFNPVIACDIAVAAEEAVFGLSEINSGIIPAGNVLKSVTSVLRERDAMYYTMTGATFDGRKAARMGLVREAVPRSELRAHVAALAQALRGKSPTALRAGKHAARRIVSLDWEDAEDHIYAKADQLRLHDREGGRQKGMAQFLDEKSYRPGLGGYKREGQP